MEYDRIQTVQDENSLLNLISYFKNTSQRIHAHLLVIYKQQFEKKIDNEDITDIIHVFLQISQLFRIVRSNIFPCRIFSTNRLNAICFCKPKYWKVCEVALHTKCWQFEINKLNGNVKHNKRTREGHWIDTMSIDPHEWVM